MKACASGLFFLLAAVLFANCGKKPSASPGAVALSPFTVRALTAERSGDHLHLTVTVRVKNPGSAPLLLASPAAQLRIGEDKHAAPFIAPGLEPAAIAPGAESEGVTHWWLSQDELSGSLEMEISGVRQPVKSAGPFPFEALPEHRATALPFPVWKAP